MKSQCATSSSATRYDKFNFMNSLRWMTTSEWVNEWLCVWKREEGLKKEKKKKIRNEMNQKEIWFLYRCVEIKNEKKVNTIHVVGVCVRVYVCSARVYAFVCACIKRQRDKWMKDQQTRDSCYRWRKADNRYASSHLHHTIVINVVAIIVTVCHCHHHRNKKATKPESGMPSRPKKKIE